MARTGAAVSSRRPKTAAGGTASTRTDLATSLPRLRRALEEHRRFRLDQLAELAAEEVASARLSEQGRIEDLDASANSARSEVSTVIAAGARRALDDIDAALDRMGTGRYGWCEQCHLEIDMRRLAALPQASLCMECQRREETAAARR